MFARCMYPGEIKVVILFVLLVFGGTAVARDSAARNRTFLPRSPAFAICYDSINHRSLSLQAL